MMLANTSVLPVMQKEYTVVLIELESKWFVSNFVLQFDWNSEKVSLQF